MLVSALKLTGERKMKLIELLVQELPKRGGWPDKNMTHMFTSHEGNVCYEGSFPRGSFYHNRKESDVPDLFLESRLISGRKVEVVTREQYESALAAAQQPVWSGVGLPPVGCECEVKVGGDNYNLCRIVYSDSNAGVAFVYLGGDDEKYCGTIDCVTAGAAYGYFRPIRSEADKKRDAVIHEIAEAMVAPQPKGNGILAQAISVYNKIASGKIPGVKLED